VLVNYVWPSGKVWLRGIDIVAGVPGDGILAGKSSFRQGFGMFGKKIHLFTLFGFKVGVDFSWVFLAVLITWSLATGVFPSYSKGLPRSTYWWMGAVGALGLFGSIIFHEFCHSIVARRFGLAMKGITLFIFGGVAEMQEEPRSAKVEFLMAIAGPLSSAALAGVFYLLYEAAKTGGLAQSVTGVLGYLTLLNLILAAFNLVPAFPLDGGRVLRSILWAARGNLRWATRVASQLGAAFGLFLIVVGVISFVTGYIISGVWYFLIGMFIRGASQMSYRQLLVRGALGGEQVSRFMESQPVVVSSSLSIEELVDEYFYRYHYKMFPVSDGDSLLGCVSTKQVKEVPREQWSERTVSEVVEPCAGENTVTSSTDAMQALAIMNRTGNSRLMVVDGGRLMGIITLKDLLRFFALKMDLEGDKEVNVGRQRGV